MDEIDHVVVVMLENRSFDHVLGWLYYPGKEGNSSKEVRLSHKENAKKATLRIVPKENETAVKEEKFRSHAFKGLAFSDKKVVEKDDFVVSEEYMNHFGDRSYPARMRLGASRGTAKKYGVWPPHELGEPFENVCRQIYNASKPETTNWTESPTMSGFAEDYKHDAEVMDSLPSGILPVFQTMGRQFGVSDEWFASVPSQTWCNRLFMLYGSSFGMVDNKPYKKTIETLQNRSPANFMTHLSRCHGIYTPQKDYLLGGAAHPPSEPLFRHRVYSHAPLLDLFSVLSSMPVDPNAYVSIENLAKDARAGTLANFSLVEPRFVPIPSGKGETYLPHNDMHPAELKDGLPMMRPTVWEAEDLILDLYDALFLDKEKGGKTPRADKTLLVVIFDEHGGTYDHVPPPTARNPHGPPVENESAFGFQRLGVRIPALFISPRVPSGTVLRGSPEAPLDHTSVIKSVFDRWSVPGAPPPSMTYRSDNAANFWPVIDKDHCRSYDEMLKLSEDLHKKVGKLRSAFGKVTIRFEITPLVAGIFSGLQNTLKQGFTTVVASVLQATSASYFKFIKRMIGVPGNFGGVKEANEQGEDEDEMLVENAVDPRDKEIEDIFKQAQNIRADFFESIEDEIIVPDGEDGKAYDKLSLSDYLKRKVPTSDETLKEPASGDDEELFDDDAA